MTRALGGAAALAGLLGSGAAAASRLVRRSRRASL